MNTIGKTLVILNFLFAIALGIFLVFHVSVRTQWKEAYHKLEIEVKVLKEVRATNATANVAVINDNRTLAGEIEKHKLTLKDAEDRMALLQAESATQINERDNKLKDAVVTHQELLKAKQRLVDEIAEQGKTIELRQAAIVKLQADVNSFRLQAIANEARARTSQLQNEALLEQMRELTAELARIKTGASADTIAIRNPNEPNPPSVVVNGKIELVDSKDGTLVQISLGSDHGVNKNHTLDVFRLQPDAKYLGMIRIVESYHQKSVGRLVAAGNPAMRQQLRADDIVTSKITK